MKNVTTLRTSDEAGAEGQSELSALLTKPELDQLTRLAHAEDVVSVEIMAKDGSPLELLTQGSYELAPIFSNVLDLALLAGAEVGETANDAIVRVRTRAFDVSCFRMTKVDAVVVRTRTTKPLAARMHHVR